MLVLCVKQMTAAWMFCTFRKYIDVHHCTAHKLVRASCWYNCLWDAEMYDFPEWTPTAWRPQHIIQFGPPFLEPNYAADRQTRSVLCTLISWSTCQPNVAVEWFTLFRIRKVQVSILGPGGRLSCLSLFVIFLISPGEYFKIRPRRPPTKSFPIHNLLIVSSMLYNRH
jgi:hypothetical protein